MDTTTAETPVVGAPVDTPDGPAFAAVLPEHFEVPIVEPEPTPPAATPTPEPTPPAAVTPPASPAPKERVLTPVAIEERNKRKEASRKWRESEAENEKLRAENAKLREQQAPKPVPTLPPLRDVVKDRVAKLKSEADSITTQGEVVERVVTELVDVIEQREREREAREQQIARQEEQERREVQARRQEIAEGEAEVRAARKDYDQRITQAGLWDRLKQDPRTGQFTDPEFARVVYAAKNPAQKLYDLAIGKLAAEAEDRGEEFAVEDTPPTPAATPPAPTPVPTPPVAVTPPSPAPAPAATPSAPVPATPVAPIPERARGVRGLPPAGNGARRAAFTREELTALMYRDLDAYRKLMDVNPGLEAWHEGVTTQRSG